MKAVISSLLLEEPVDDFAIILILRLVIFYEQFAPLEDQHISTYFLQRDKRISLGMHPWKAFPKLTHIFRANIEYDYFFSISSAAS